MYIENRFFLANALLCLLQNIQLGSVCPPPHLQLYTKYILIAHEHSYTKAHTQRARASRRLKTNKIVLIPKQHQSNAFWLNRSLFCGLFLTLFFSYFLFPFLFSLLLLPLLWYCYSVSVQTNNAKNSLHFNECVHNMCQ